MLNAHYAALRVVSVRRAFTLLFKKNDHLSHVAEVVAIENDRYVTYDFDDWLQLSSFKEDAATNDHERIKTVTVNVLIPRIIRVLSFTRIPRHNVKFNRRSVLARDNHTCQYCGHSFPPTQLTLDHVIPRTQQGPTTWDNVVCACHRCNVKKGGRTPYQAGVRLIHEPIKPTCNPTITIKLTDKRYETWRPFLESANHNIAFAV